MNTNNNEQKYSFIQLIVTLLLFVSNFFIDNYSKNSSEYAITNFIEKNFMAFSNLAVLVLFLIFFTKYSSKKYNNEIVNFKISNENPFLNKKEPQSIVNKSNIVLIQFIKLTIYFVYSLIGFYIFVLIFSFFDLQLKGQKGEIYFNILFMIDVLVNFFNLLSAAYCLGCFLVLFSKFSMSKFNNYIIIAPIITFLLVLTGLTLGYSEIYEYISGGRLKEFINENQLNEYIKNNELKEYVNNSKLKIYIDDIRLKKYIDDYKLEEHIDNIRLKEFVDDGILKVYINGNRLKDYLDINRLNNLINIGKLKLQIDNEFLEKYHYEKHLLFYVKLFFGVLTGICMSLMFNRINSLDYFFEVEVTSFEIINKIFNLSLKFIFPLYVISQPMIAFVQPFSILEQTAIEDGLKKNNLASVPNIIFSICFLGKSFYFIFLHQILSFKKFSKFVYCMYMLDKVKDEKLLPLN